MSIIESHGEYIDLAREQRESAWCDYEDSDQYKIDLSVTATQRLLNDEDFRDDVLTEVMIYDMTKFPELLVDDPAEFGRVAKAYAMDRAKLAVAEEVAKQWALDYDNQ